jgi:hypothetical protein
MLDEIKINIIWNEYKEQREWQRHNENQRAQLTSILLSIAAALVAFMPRDLKRDDWTIPAFLVGIGIFGVLAVMKYWERFVYHAQLVKAYREVIDLYFALDDNQLDKNQGQKFLFLETREQAIAEHNKCHYPLLKDKYLMEHWLWKGVFMLITLLGIVLLVKALSK